MKNKLLIILLTLIVTITGCSKADPEESLLEENEEITILDTLKEEEEPEEDNIQEVDFQEIFAGRQGAAVFYTPSNRQFAVYNTAIANTRYSPCSTFKLISTLMGLKYGAVDSPETVKPYDGNPYPRDNWNQDMSLTGAFQTSCVWYYRQMTNDLDPAAVGTELQNLGYGNCDISRWDGNADREDLDPRLQGFWIDSSLTISPLEQVKVLAKIVEGESDFPAEHIEMLKAMMYSEVSGLYGKTGTGEQAAWYVGFYTEEETNIYFAVYLNRENTEVTSAEAEAIAAQIIANSRELSADLYSYN